MKNARGWSSRSIRTRLLCPVSGSWPPEDCGPRATPTVGIPASCTLLGPEAPAPQPLNACTHREAPASYDFGGNGLKSDAMNQTSIHCMESHVEQRGGDVQTAAKAERSLVCSSTLGKQAEGRPGLGSPGIGAGACDQVSATSREGDSAMVTHLLFW